MTMLAVVSKAIFEKEARAGKRLLGVGDVWPTSRYASTSPSLDPLRSGGDLVLVTVRPGDVLWLVGVLETPERDDGGWTAKPSTRAAGPRRRVGHAASEGQKPRRLQEKATSRSKPHRSQPTRTQPCSRRPHRRYSSTSRWTKRGRPPASNRG